MAASPISDTGDSVSSTRSLEAGEAWRNSRGSARTLRYVSLLYTAFFFIEPYFRHSTSHWLWFFAFYVTFIALYFAVAAARGRMQLALIAAMFLLAFAYFPFNSSTSGAFVYPAVLLAFVIRSTRAYILSVLFASLGLLLETWLFHLPVWSGLLGVFFCVVIGFSNLAYSRQQQASYMLQRANEEIEHLAQVAERERIARDLHDLLGHTLTVIAIKSELAHRLIDRDAERARQEMQDVEQTARKALQDVREAVTGYRTQGVGAELQRAQRTLDAAGVTVATDVQPDTLPPQLAGVLCLCLREAVTNIVRHAQARNCTLHLRQQKQAVTLTIRDDGTGFTGISGNGLTGMHERVRAVHGTMQIQALQPTGTELRVCIPIQEPCHQESPS